MKSKEQIQEDIAEVEMKLDETLEDVNYNSGPTRDAMRLVIPMMKDMCSLMRDVLEHDKHTHFVDPRGATTTGMPEER